MELLVNDLSFQRQFKDIASFRGAIERLMVIRQVAMQYGWPIYCHRAISHAAVTPTMNMPQAVQTMTQSERRAILQWVTQLGPFWDDERNHSPDDWFEWNDQIVTDSAVGEAAWFCLNGIDHGLVSLTPSDWEFSPVPVEILNDTVPRKSVDVQNYWDPAAAEAVLKAAPAPLPSWGHLEQVSPTRFPNLSFAADAFAPLVGYPFAPGAANRLLFILKTLNHFKTCFDSNGERTAEGHEIYRNFFTGKKGEGGRGALFSDSSDGEKNDFEMKLTFKHPIEPGKSLFCPWHGKVQTPPLRVHFSWPVRANEPILIVYVGPKLTIR